MKGHELTVVAQQHNQALSFKFCLLCLPCLCLSCLCDKPEKGDSFVDAVWGMAGVRGFGQGLLARTLTIAPGAAMQWFIYERVKLHLLSMKSSAT